MIASPSVKANRKGGGKERRAEGKELVRKKGRRRKLSILSGKKMTRVESRWIL